MSATGGLPLLAALILTGWSAPLHAEQRTDGVPVTVSAEWSDVPAERFVGLERLLAVRLSAHPPLTDTGADAGEAPWRAALLACVDATCPRALSLPGGFTVAAGLSGTGSSRQLRASAFDTVRGRFSTATAAVSPAANGLEAAAAAVAAALANGWGASGAAATQVVQLPEAAITPVPPASTSAWQRIPLWTRGLGVAAVAALATGAILGAWSGELTANPPQTLRDGTVVQSYSQVAGQQAYELAIGANVLFGVGALLGIGAGTVWALESKGASSP